ncbi:MAG: MFS transporter [Chloroflexi bacterium]|nr:MFS transporter [Chloroflexota bacterium]
MHTEDTVNGKLYYGWYIAFTLAITETISWGIIYYAFTVFLTPMETELGWSRGQLTGGFSLMLLVAGVMAFPVGAWIDKHGSRWLMTIGSICASLLVITWSQVTDITAFYLIWAGLGICAAAILYEPAFAVIATWFVRRRGTALAIITFAAGLASTIFVPLSDALLNAFGWRDAVLILGVALAVTTILPHALILRRRPDDLGFLPDGDVKRSDSSPPMTRGVSLTDALHSRFFWLLTLAFSLSYLSASAIRVHFIPFLIDSGIDASSAALASGTIGIMQVAGRLVFAPLDTRVSARVMTAGVFALQAAAMGILLLGSSTLAVALFIIVFGTSYGASTLARPSILAEMFGSTHYGRISSIVAIFVTFAATSAPVGAGLLYDRFGSYVPVLWIVLLLAVGATAVMLIAKPNLAQAQNPPPIQMVEETQSTS